MAHWSHLLITNPDEVNPGVGFGPDAESSRRVRLKQGVANNLATEVGMMQASRDDEVINGTTIACRRHGAGNRASSELETPNLFKSL